MGRSPSVCRWVVCCSVSVVMVFLMLLSCWSLSYGMVTWLDFGGSLWASSVGYPAVSGYLSVHLVILGRLKGVLVHPFRVPPPCSFLCPSFFLCFFFFSFFPLFLFFFPFFLEMYWYNSIPFPLFYGGRLRFGSRICPVGAGCGWYGRR